MCYFLFVFVFFIFILLFVLRVLILIVIRKIIRIWLLIREEGIWEGGNYKSCLEKKGLRVVKDKFS